MKKILSIVLTLVLLATLSVFGAYAAKPVAGDWTAVGDEVSVSAVDKGLEAVFEAGYDAADTLSLGADKSFNLDGLSLEFQDIETADNGILIYMGNFGTASLDLTKTCFASLVTADGRFIIARFTDGQNGTGDLLDSFSIEDFSGLDELSFSVKKDGDKWFAYVGDKSFEIPSNYLEGLTDTSKITVSVSAYAGEPSASGFSFVLIDASDSSEPKDTEPTEAPADTTAAPTSGDTTAKPTTPATGESTAVFAIVAVLAVSAVVLVASKRRAR